MTIDGKMIHFIPLLIQETFSKVKVFAGNNLHDPADASYRNLFWENLPVPDYLFHMYTPSIVSRGKV